MAQVTGVDHVGVTVSDVDRSLGFWRDLLGLEVTGRGVMEWEHLDRLVALRGTTDRVVRAGVAGWREGRTLSIPPPGRRCGSPG